MKSSKLSPFLWALLVVTTWSCKPTLPTNGIQVATIPESFRAMCDTTGNMAKLKWRAYFDDPQLAILIDSALARNMELSSFNQELIMAKVEIDAAKGEYLPTIGFGAGSGLEKTPRFTPRGAVEEQLTYYNGKAFPEPIADFQLGFSASWEIDIWKRLRNAKEAQVNRYLAGLEGRNFLVTELVAELANAYYELLALDNLNIIIDQNIEIQQSALSVVKQQKDAAKVTELAVNRFEAQLLNTQALKFGINQRIVALENQIRFLCGSPNLTISRAQVDFVEIKPTKFNCGVPSALLENRPDIRQAKWQLEAAKLDLKSAGALFYPSVGLGGAAGIQALNPQLLLQPESFLFGLTADVFAPLINRKALKANYQSANARQLQAIVNYNQTVLSAYLDVVTQLSLNSNATQSLETKAQEVVQLQRATSIANSLFNNARADYAEVLLTQREALEAKIELVELKSMQLQAKVNLYRALGGGWQ